MSQFHNMPAIQDILRSLGNGETLSRKEIFASVGREMKRDQQEKLIEAGYIIINGKNPLRYTLTSKGTAYVRNELGGAAGSIPDETAKLSTKERIALFALLSPSLQMSAVDVKRTRGVTVAETERESLASKGLVTVLRDPLRFELTAKGWEVAEAELCRPPRLADPSLLKLLHHLWAQALGELRSHHLGLVDLFTEDRIGPAAAPSPEPKTVGARVIDAYSQLVYHPGGWVSLTRLREHLADITRTELDEVLSALFRQSRISLIAEVNQKVLTEEDRQAALRIVGDEKHLYAVS